VHPGGNPTAQKHLRSAFEIWDSNWRGIGIIPASGFELQQEYRAHDARRLFPNYADAERTRIGEMPAGCDCARVVLGKIYPNQCVLYGSTCTPHDPVGPCMVSDEGACRIWWASGKRERC
jgi:hydrogenase expression/formation protein HypD